MLCAQVGQRPTLQFLSRQNQTSASGVKGPPFALRGHRAVATQDGFARALRFLCNDADRQDGAAELFVKDFGHGQIDGAGAAENSFPSGNVAEQYVVLKVIGSQQEKEECERSKNNLKRPVGFERADEHVGGEDAPHGQIAAREFARGRFNPSQLGHNDKGDEADPEKAVGGEGRQAEGVAFFEFEYAGNHLRDSAVAKAHGQNHAAERKKARIVNVQ